MSLRDRLHLSGEPVYLIDGTAFFFRGFYAFRDMSRSDGFPTNALFVTLRMIMKLLREEKPAYIAFFLDGPDKHFRHERYPEYKAQRTVAPDQLIQQLEPLKRGLTLLGVPVFVSQGGEADDCIASLAARCKATHPVVILGADKDFNQCLDTQVLVWDPAQKNEKLTTAASFAAENGMNPTQWPDYQALIGDSSDNIPGIVGVGPKTAKIIIDTLPTLEDIRDRLGELPEKLRKKLEGQVDNAFLYRELTRLRTDMCADLTLDAIARREPDWRTFVDFLAEWEFRSLPRELPPEASAALRQTAKAETPKPAQQGSLDVSASGSPTESSGGEPQAPQASLSAAQLSLFGPQAASANLPPLPVRDVDQPYLLPRVAGRAIGLVMLHGDGGQYPEIRLGIGHEEIRWTGDIALLCSALHAAAAIATPDLKALLRTPTALPPPISNASHQGPAPTDPSPQDCGPAGGTLCAWAALPLDRCVDLGLAAYLLSPEDRSYDWPRLRDMALSGSELDTAPLHPQSQGLAALSLHEALGRKLAAAGLNELLRTLEMPLIPVLATMEARGIAVDQQAFASFLTEVNREIERLSAVIHGHAGGPFNIRSNQQLATLLFETLGLKAKGKTPGGQLSTANPVLEKLKGEHPVIGEILEFRMLEKLRGTYLEPLPRLADGAGRIHTSFNQTSTATGRLSSSGPNLQNIPIRGRLGSRMRACFTAAPGRLLIAADYSQIELRVLAHMSQDPTLLAAFRDGHDIHARTAALMYDKPETEVRPEERRGAKTINFGLLYGMGPQKLAQELAISLTQAKEFIARYFERLAALKAFYETIVAGAETQGYVTTIAGRRRLLPDILSRNDNLKALARRQAVNTVIQGSAADIIKLAMLAVDKDELLHSANARLLLQVHDELVLEAPEAAAPSAAKRVQTLMSEVVALSVPLLVDAGVGKNWAEAH